MPTIQILEKLRQEDCHEIKFSPGYNNEFQASVRLSRGLRLWLI